MNEEYKTYHQALSELGYAHEASIYQKIKEGLLENGPIINGLRTITQKSINAFLGKYGKYESVTKTIDEISNCEWVGTNAAARILGVCTTTIKKWAQLGILKCKIDDKNKCIYDTKWIKRVLESKEFMAQCRKHNRRNPQTNITPTENTIVKVDTDESWISAYGSELLKARFQNGFNYESLLKEERQIKEHVDTHKLIYTALNQEGVFKDFRLVHTEINSNNYEEQVAPELNEIRRLNEFKSKVSTIKNAEVSLVFDNRFQCLSYVMFRYKPDPAKTDTLDYIFLA